MSKDVSIVTFFFDIGRSKWTPDRGLPHYLHVTLDTYLNRFKNMCELDNQIVVFTSPEFVDLFKEYRKGKEDKTVVVPFDYFSSFKEEKLKILNVLKNPEFQNKVNPHQRVNPEYWNCDYDMLMYLKSFFVKKAIDEGLVTNDQVAYVDFGYIKSEDKIPKSKKLRYDFGDKFNFFGYKHLAPGRRISDVIYNNDVHVHGAAQVGRKEHWSEVNRLINESFNQLIENNLIDDDQTLWLMAYLKKPDMFNFNIIPDHQYGHNPFVLFELFNEEK